MIINIAEITGNDDFPVIYGGLPWLFILKWINGFLNQIWRLWRIQFWRWGQGTAKQQPLQACTFTIIGSSFSRAVMGIYNYTIYKSKDLRPTNMPPAYHSLASDGDWRQHTRPPGGRSCSSSWQVLDRDTRALGARREKPAGTRHGPGQGQYPVVLTGRGHYSSLLNMIHLSDDLARLQRFLPQQDCSLKLQSSQSGIHFFNKYLLHTHNMNKICQISVT